MPRRWRTAPTSSSPGLSYKDGIITVAIFTLPTSHPRLEAKDSLFFAEASGQSFPVKPVDVPAAPALAKNLTPFGKIRERDLVGAAGWGRITSRLSREADSSPGGISYVSLQRSR
ncbi:hypothetical protein [Sinorhizobium sp. NG07B]|uniref:hypothetical protein n=1 Tax=Sinorhizobium sp. NG07B TaxID=1538174 RepID=UPI00159692DD|nr:hypothetical protein [Sinorhizobium sp. NG07B]